MKRIATAVCALALVAFAPVSPALAEEQAPVYTRVGLWEVKRAMWPAFVKAFESFDQPVMEKLMASGVINEWGIDSTFLHDPEGYTHTTWYSATSYEALGKVDEAYEAAAKALGEKESARMDAEFSAMILKHRDLLLRSLEQHAVAARLDHAKYFAAEINLKLDEEDTFRSYWDAHVKPTYQKMMDDGVILAYGLSQEEMSTRAGNTVTSWYAVRDMAGIDKVKAAFDAYRATLSPAQRRERWSLVKETVDVDSFRESGTDMIHWAIAKQ